VALGIFSFAVVGIVYLLGSGLSSSRDSAKDSSIAAALHSVDSSLRIISSGTLSKIATSGTAGTYYFDLFGNPAITSGTTQNIYYTAVVTRVDAPSVSGTIGITSPPFTAAEVSDSQNRQFLWKVTFYYPYVSPTNLGPISTHLLTGQADYDSLP